MRTQIRIWRAQAVSKTGAKAPYFFVETEEFKLEKAQNEAIKLAEERCVLCKFDNWYMTIDKLNKRKDAFNRYWTYHQ